MLPSDSLHGNPQYDATAPTLSPFLMSEPAVMQPSAPGAAAGFISDEALCRRHVLNLSSRVKRSFGGRLPVAFTVGDARGVGGNGEHVTIGRCVLLLVDPVQSDCVGDYEMHIFAAEGNATETADFPVVKVSISPWSRAVRSASVVVEIAMHGAKEGPHTYTLQFHSAIDAEAFDRDFQVRCKVMKLSLRNARQQRGGWSIRPHSCGRGLCYQLKCLVFYAMAILIGFFAVHAFVLSKADVTQEPVEFVAAAFSDAKAAAFYIGQTAVEVGTYVGATACSSVCAGQRAGSLSMAQLERCLALTGTTARVECAQDLVPSAPGAAAPDPRPNGIFENLWKTGGSGVENIMTKFSFDEAGNCTSCENTGL